jgi:hypothetical protein
MGDGELPPIQAALIFVNEKATVEAEDAPTPTMKAAKLKDYIRKRTKDNSLTPEKLDEINEIMLK